MFYMKFAFIVKSSNIKRLISNTIFAKSFYNIFSWKLHFWNVHPKNHIQSIHVTFSRSRFSCYLQLMPLGIFFFNVNLCHDIQEIHSLRAQLEAAKYEVIKYCIGTLVSISAVGLAVLRILMWTGCLVSQLTM